jgi:hypothetical protein
MTRRRFAVALLSLLVLVAAVGGIVALVTGGGDGSAGGRDGPRPQHGCVGEATATDRVLRYQFSCAGDVLSLLRLVPEHVASGENPLGPATVIRSSDGPTSDPAQPRAKCPIVTSGHGSELLCQPEPSLASGQRISGTLHLEAPACQFQVALTVTVPTHSKFLVGRATVFRLDRPTC